MRRDRRGTARRLVRRRRPVPRGAALRRALRCGCVLAGTGHVLTPPRPGAFLRKVSSFITLPFSLLLARFLFHLVHARTPPSQDDTHAAAGMRVPWYRGAEWSYLRGGLSTLDRDYGPLFNALHHNIGTHVVHHLFPQIPHYHLQDATQAAAPVMGPYYRRPDASPGVFPSHLVSAAARSFASDHVVADAGDVVFYERSDDASLPSLFRASLRALRTRWAARRGVAA